MTIGSAYYDEMKGVLFFVFFYNQKDYWRIAGI